MSDTLVIDSAQIVQWQSQQDFDYNRELVGGGTTFYEWLTGKLRELLQDIFGQMWNSSFTSMFLVLLGVLALTAIGLYLWRYHPGLFKGKDSLPAADSEGEDTIYGVDFETSIRQAVGRADWREAIRLRYLQTLKALSDNGQIDWQPFKTPTQYVREMSLPQPLPRRGEVPTATQQLTPNTSPARAAAMRALTAHFLRVRYGNFPATQELYEEVCDLRKEVDHGA
jgi:hypothetical protein